MPINHVLVCRGVKAAVQGRSEAQGRFTGPSLERALGASAACLDGFEGRLKPFEVKGRGCCTSLALCLPARE